VNEPSLPDDLALWPEDPYELLGIERGATPKDAKRNYTRLIRVFKPEHHPEHFRRLREAYESVVRSIEFFSRFADHAEVPTEAPASDGHPEISPAAAPRIDEASLLWERACEGSEDEAYRGLQNLHLRGDRSSSISLRLYWLLTLDLGLDAEREPCDWLLEALRSYGVHGSALELYRREVEANPAEAFHARFDELLTLDAPSPVIAETYEWRWTAARKMDRFDVIRADLEVAHRKFFGGDETHWLRLLMVAADATAWTTGSDRDLWIAIGKEVEQVSHLSTRYGDWFDQFEHLNQISKEWFSAKGHWRQISLENSRYKKNVVPHELFLDLIKVAWHAPLPPYRAVLMKMLAAISINTNVWLQCLDEHRQKYPAVFGAFALILQYAAAQSETVPEAPAEQVARRTADFVAGFDQFKANLRESVVQFCQESWIDPLEMVQAVVDNRVDWRSDLSPEMLVQIDDDWPVRMLCQANRLFWQCD